MKNPEQYERISTVLKTIILFLLFLGCINSDYGQY